MNDMPKLLIAAGVVLIVIGLIWAVGGKYINLGRLPGDIVVEKENFRFYFPIVTCLVLSIGLSAVLYIIRMFMK